MATAALYMATGLIWTARSLLEVIAHPQYWEPVTQLDWLAVWSYSLGFLLLAPTLVLIAHAAQGGQGNQVVAWFAAVTAIMAGVGNALEDGADLAALSSMYVIGALGTLIGLIVLAAVLWVRRRPRSGLAVALIAIGLALNTFGLGVLVLVGAVVALRAGLTGDPDVAAAARTR